MSTVFGPAVLFAVGTVPARSPPRPPVRSRSKLWELNPSIHCSIIGTCLTTAELRRVMGKVLQADLSRTSDHDLHSQAVGFCVQHGPAAKLLQKALDQRHEIVVKRFSRLSGNESVLAAWADARASGDIPGAYWAVLTHQDTGYAGIRQAFGDVHMLSHLVGAANRADIRRLTVLEEENTALRAKVERQQARLHQAVTSRDATIRQLGALAAARPHADPVGSAADSTDALAGLRHLVSDLQGRLERETARRRRLEQRLVDAADTAQRCERGAAMAEAAAAAARRELQMLESLAAAPGAAPPGRLPARRILYVGGRPAVVEQIRTLLHAAGGMLLCHDGERHDHISLLPGLVGQADQVVFPVDCISHDAALTAKRLCRQLEKPFVALRSTGLASFLAAVGDATTASEALSASPSQPLRSCTCIHP